MRQVSRRGSLDLEALFDRSDDDWVEEGVDVDLADRAAARRDHVLDRLELDGVDEALRARGTTVIAGDGSLGDYLHTLDELRSLADSAALRVLLPGHGPLLNDPAEVLDYYIAHRRERLDQVRSALAAGARTPTEVVAVVYADVDKSLWPAAELSVRAQLDYLSKESSLC